MSQLRATGGALGPGRSSDSWKGGDEDLGNVGGVDTGRPAAEAQGARTSVWPVRVGPSSPTLPLRVSCWCILFYLMVHFRAEALSQPQAHSRRSEQAGRHRAYPASTPITRELGPIS